VNAVEVLIEGRGAALLYACARVSGLVAVAPLPWAVAPIRIRALLVIVLGVAASVGPSELPVDGLRPLAVALTMISELCIGACMGFVVRLVIASAEMAADIIGPQLGLGVAGLFDPHMHVSETAVGSAYRHMAVLLATLAGLHREALAVMLGSFQLLPAGVVLNPGRFGPVALALLTTSLEAGVRIAIPVVAVLFMVQIGLAFISRAAPAMQIFSVGFAVTLAVGLSVLISTVPDAARVILVEISHVVSRMQSVLDIALEAQP
jgi:flagellar biosynthetic protein FliR